MVFSENGVGIIGYPHGKKEDKKGRREGGREREESIYSCTYALGDMYRNVCSSIIHNVLN